MSTFKSLGPFRVLVPIVDKNGAPLPAFARALNDLYGNTSHLSDNKQNADKDLATIAALTGTGIAARTETNAWALRTLQAGDSISITNPDGVAGDPSIACTISQYTDENAQDAVGTILADTPTIDLSYDDTAGTITASVKAASIGSTELDTTGVTAAVYGDATHSARIQIDANGRVVAASSVAISASGGSGGAVVPMVDGAEPPTLLTDGAGQLILVPWG